MKVKWTAVKNTEREAIRKHGDVWFMVSGRSGAKTLIESPDKSDLRWIAFSQIVETALS